MTISEMLISLQKGKWQRVVIPVTNNKPYDVTLTPHTVLGHLQQVRSVYPADLRPAKALKNTTTNRTVDESESKTTAPSGQREKDMQS